MFPHYLLMINLHDVDYKVKICRGLETSTNIPFMMNAAAPEGTPPRRISN